MTLICFDLDGTLVRSHKAHVMAFNAIFKRNGLPEVDRDRLESFFGLAGWKIVKGVFPELSDDECKKISDQHSAELLKCCLGRVDRVEGVKRMLMKLKEDGYKLALISNSLRRSMIPLLETGGIDSGMFDVIVGRDEVPNPKPEPDEVLAAMEKTGESEVYVVGDTVYDIQAGKKAGAKTVGVLSGYQKREQLEKEDPDYVLESAAGIIDVLKKG